MHIFKKNTFPDRPYYATRAFVLHDYGAKRKREVTGAAIIGVIFWFVLLLSNVTKFTVDSVIAVILFIGAILLFTFLMLRLVSTLNHSLVAREHIEHCVDHLSEYDSVTLETIEKMAQNDSSGTQISTALTTTALGIGMVILLGNLLRLEYALPIGGFVAVVIPLILLLNSEQDSVNVVIRQAVAIQLDTLCHEKSNQSDSV